MVLRAISAGSGASSADTLVPRQAGDGVTDVTAVLQSKFIQAQAGNGVLRFPPGVFRYSARIGLITDRMTIVGAGKKQTWLKPMASYSGFAFTVDDCWRNAAESDAIPQTLSTIDFDALRAGVIFSDFYIAGDRLNAANGIEFVSRNDCALMQRVGFQHLRGRALSLAATGPDPSFVRESYFSDIEVISCGDDGVAAIDIDTVATGGTPSDGTNQITFTNLRALYNYWNTLRIRNSSGIEERTRRIRIHGCMLHGMLNDPAAPAADLLSVEGNVWDVAIYGLRTNGSHKVGGTKYACVRLKDDGNPSRRPRSVYCEASMTSCHGHGIVVDRADAVRIDIQSDGGTIGDLSGTGNEVQFSASSLGSLSSVYRAGTGTPTVVIDDTVSHLVAREPWPEIAKAKAADQSVSLSTTLVDVTDLYFRVGANETWEFDFTVFGNAGLVGDLKLGVSAPSAPTLLRYGGYGLAVSAINQTGTINAVVADSGGMNYGGGAVNCLYPVKGLIKNGANSGLVRLQMAQATSDPGNSTVLAGSYLKAKRIE